MVNSGPELISGKELEDIFRFLQIGMGDETSDAIVRKAMLSDDNAMAKEYMDALEDLRGAQKLYRRAAKGLATITEKQASVQLSKALMKESSLREDLDSELKGDKVLARISLKAVQKMLAAEEAFVLYRVRKTAAFALVVTRTNAQLISLDTAYPEVKDLVGQIRDSLGFDHAPVAFPYSAAHSLYEKVLAPVEKMVGNQTRLIVLPNGLESLPLSVLITKPTSATCSPSLAPWAAHRFAFSYVTSVAAFKLLRSKQTSKKEKRPFVGFGDPLFVADVSMKEQLSSENQVRGLTILSKERVLSLPRLHETRNELLTIASVLGAKPSSVYLGESATETQVKSMVLSDVSVLAFATHSIRSNPLVSNEPSLVFTTMHKGNAEDGLLSTSEVSRLKLDADWVLLSACNTAAGNGGEEKVYSGLARSFFLAGANSVLVSHWAVESKATTQLMIRLFDSSIKKTTKDIMLQRARLSLIKDERYSHPSCWAPFVLLGDSRKIQ